MSEQRCRKLPMRSFAIGAQRVVAWDARQDPCADPAIYHVGIDRGREGGGLLTLPGHIERVPFATKPGATFKARTGEVGAETHYGSLSGAVGHLVSRCGDAERAKGWAKRDVLETGGA